MSSQINRRSVLRWFSVLAGGAIIRPNALIAAAMQEPAYTAPPTDESPEIAALIDQAARAIGAKPESVSEVLCDETYMPVHEWPRFRELIRDSAPTGEISIASRGEPGARLRITCTIRNERSKPVAGAMVYLYQTSAKGWYSDRAPHFSGNSGDQRHARLFGYVKTDDAGRFVLHTIRPGGYPRTDLPQHIHIEIKPAEETLQALVSEILFDDDPRLSAPARQRAARAGFTIIPVEHRGDGLQVATVKFELKKPKRDD